MRSRKELLAVDSWSLKVALEASFSDAKSEGKMTYKATISLAQQVTAEDWASWGTAGGTYQAEYSAKFRSDFAAGWDRFDEGAQSGTFTEADKYGPGGLAIWLQAGTYNFAAPGLILPIRVRDGDQHWVDYQKMWTPDVDDIPLPGSGSLHGLDERTIEGARVKTSWSLVPGAPTPLEARQPEYGAVERGAELVLDGTESTGRIGRWTWTITQVGDIEGETPRTSQISGTGDPVGMKAKIRPLRPIQVELKVFGEGRESTSTKMVDVLPRQAEEWRRMPRSLTFGWDETSLTKQVMACGHNYCAEFDEGPTPHNVHPGGRPNSYRGGHWAEGKAYVIGRIQDDGGPWNGHYWITHHYFKLAREAQISNELRPASVLWRKNVIENKGKRPPTYDIAAVARAVRLHEKLHFDLMVEALDQPDARRNCKGDPIPRLEQLVAADPDTIRGAVDEEMADIHLEIEGTDLHATIRERLTKAGYDRPAKLWVHDGPRTAGKWAVFEIPSIAAAGTEDS